MDYGKLKEALVLIKETCKDSNCCNCLLGTVCGVCLLTDVSPASWDIEDEQKDEQFIRLLK